MPCADTPKDAAAIDARPIELNGGEPLAGVMVVGDRRMRSRWVVHRTWRGLVRAGIAVAVALGPSALAGQASLVEDWRWVRFGVAEGLPSAVVSAVTRASDGTIWAGTDEGPAWFDGYRWRPVRRPDGRGVLRGARTPRIWPGAHGEVLVSFGPDIYRVGAGGTSSDPLPRHRSNPDWNGTFVGTADGEVWAVFIREKRWILTHLRDGVWHDVAWPGLQPATAFQPRLYAPRDGGLLVSVGGVLWQRADSAWAAYARFTTGSGIVTHYVRGAGGEERLVLESPDATQGVWARGPSTGASPWVRVASFAHEAPVAFDYGADGSAVAILDAGDFLYADANGWRNLHAPQSLATTTSLTYDANGDVWFSTRRGIVLWRRLSDRWMHWRLARSAPANRVNGLAVDSTGRIAMATAGGVAYGEPDGRLRGEDGLPRLAFTSIERDQGGHLWAGSGGAMAGVFQQTATGWVHRTDAPHLGTAGVHRMVRGRNGTLWLLGLPIGRNDTAGVWRVADGRIEEVALSPAARGARYYDMVEDSAGTRWFVTDRGVMRERGGSFTVIGTAQGMPADQPFCIALGDGGGVWVGLRSTGVVHISADLRVERPPASAPHPTGSVRALHRAENGSVWASDADGIWVLAGGSWSLLTETFGLPTPAVWPITSRQGDVYVGTLGAGVLRLRLAEFRAAVPAVWILPPVRGDRGLQLHWNVATRNGVVAPEEVLTRWRLDDGAWSEWSDRHEAIETGRLPWRSHTLLVEARTPLGVQAAAPARLAFSTPAPAWWRREVLGVVAALLALLAWLGVLLLRRRRQQETLARRVRDAEQMELVGSFAAGMAHELNNLLTAISVNAELVEDAPGHESPSPSDEIRRAAMQAAGQLRSVLAFTRDHAMVLEAVNLSALLQEQQAPVGALFPSGIEVHWQIPPHPVRVQAEPNAIAAILRALAENARDSMTTTGRFDVTLRSVRLDAPHRRALGLADAPGHAELVVADSGAGMTAEQSLRALEPRFPARDGPGSGLVLVHGLMRRFGGAVQMESSTGSGTTLRLFFPMIADASAA